MHVIYHSPQFSLSALVAAAIHLGKIICDRKPTVREIRTLTSTLPWARARKGIIYPVGIDTCGDRVYILYRGLNPTVLVNVLYGIADMIGQNERELALINTELSSRLHWQLGRIFLLGYNRFSPLLEIEATFFALVDLVSRQKGLPISPRGKGNKH